MNEPLISVIVPVYNTEKYVAEALDSIFAQDYLNLEVIVVDDGSTDNTLNVLKEYPRTIRIISQESNKGQSMARNIGVKEAQGSIIGLLDADDLWPENHISLSIEYLKNDSNYDFVRGKTQYFRFIDNRKEMTESVFLDMMVGASLYKAKIFDMVGLFNEDMKTGEDLDWFLRVAENNCREKRLEETMLLYRRHENNLTNAKGAIAQGQLNAYREKIKRGKNNSIN